jgi:hypothetical protein
VKMTPLGGFVKDARWEAKPQGAGRDGLRGIVERLQHV